jgi:hypothetical protein
MCCYHSVKTKLCRSLNATGCPISTILEFVSRPRKLGANCDSGNDVPYKDYRSPLKILGLKLGLMPFGTVIGKRLPQKSPLPVVLFITLLLGIGVTFAEPAISALKAAGQNVSVERAPYLFALLNDWSGVLVLVIGLSVGLAAVTGTLRFLYGWSLKPLIYISFGPVLGLTLYGASDPELTKILGLAWDAGAVTTGPVTVPQWALRSQFLG